MPLDDRQLGREGPVSDVQVGAAQANVVHAKPRLARPGTGLGLVHQHRLLGFDGAGDEHKPHTSKSTRTSVAR